jgi:hypothetical protein
MWRNVKGEIELEPEEVDLVADRIVKALEKISESYNMTVEQLWRHTGKAFDSRSSARLPACRPR